MSENGNLPKFIVMDIVFKGRSLNYDQGAGNYQELKKITKFDGKQYTMVSRYALRYSILQIGKRMGFWDFYNNFGKDEKDKGNKNKNVLQPNISDIHKLIHYPEFDLFGFMITSGNKEEMNFYRESPVKITHAVSLTPFNFDTHTSGNHWLVQRAIESGKLAKMDINLFTREEHDTFYGYTVIIDTRRVGEIVIYATKTQGKNIIKKAKDDNITPNVKEKEKVLEIHFQIPIEEKKRRIEHLIEAIFHATREIKGSSSSLRPYILVLGLYNKNYDTYLDKIQLLNEYEQIKEVEKVLIDEKHPEKGEKIIEKIKITRSPKFKLTIDEMECSEFEDVDNLSKEIWERISQGVEGVKVYKAKGVELGCRGDQRES